MSSTRIWVIISVAVIVAILAGGWFIGTQPLLDAAATSALSTVDAQTRNAALEGRLAALSRTAAKKADMQVEDAVLQKAVPTILKPNTFNRRVTEVAALEGVKMRDVTLGQAVPYSVPASLVAPVASADPSASTPAATPAPAPASPSGLALAKADPLITAADFAAVPVSMTVVGTQDAVLSFSTAIQNDERVFLINGVATTRDDTGTTVGTLSGYIYTLNR